MSNTTSDPDRLERDLDETRSRLGSHLSELEDRLSPGQILDNVMAYLRGSEGAEMGRNLVESMRANPMPAALTGVGLAWLMATNQRADTARQPDGVGLRSSRVRVYPETPDGFHYGRDDHTATMTRLQEAEERMTRNPGESDSDYSVRLNEARGKAVGLARHAQETAEGFGSRVRDVMESAKQAVAGGAQNARDRISETARASGGSARDAGGQMVSTLTESPVLLGALGLAAGALLGSLIPQTEREEAALGGIAGQARRSATDLANEGWERGQRVARTVAEKTKESASEHGLSADRSVGETVDAALRGELADNAKQVAQDTLGAARDAARTEATRPREGQRQTSD